ncbi:DUF429 domain-containing protein [Niveibacterium umoris]|uniref:DUF429 domain-containing protein n=1 Tax=Niveibacterium umoris TaxID=1193620 RepID=UPI0030B8104E
MSRLSTWASFDEMLHTPGPWLGAFDFPFGLPREGVWDLGWPTDWASLVAHCTAMGKDAFKQALDAYRSSRPYGARYPHRATDAPAKSHSPFKLVNPPVGLMFLAGAPRLLAAGLTIPGMHQGDPSRVAVEAYPALVARRHAAGSYKSDDPARWNDARRTARITIIDGVLNAGINAALSLNLGKSLRVDAIEDASGDTLDAILALTQAATAWTQRHSGYALPPSIDPIEGWIAGADSLR